VAAVALVIPAAGLADNGGGARQLKGLANQLKARVNECKHASSPAARKECVDHLVSFLQDVKQKIDAVEATIKQKCSGSTTGRCARAEQLVDRLEKLKARIDQLIAKLEGGEDGATSTSTSNQDPNIAAIEAALGSLSP
jgi:DNA repair exonuclease SbcCD ATPase subunit